MELCSLEKELAKLGKLPKFSERLLYKQQFRFRGVRSRPTPLKLGFWAGHKHFVERELAWGALS